LRPEAIKREELVPALIGAGICLFFSRNSLLVLFFLMPLGFLAFRYGYRVAWGAVLLVIAGNTFIAVGTAVSHGFALTGTFWGVFYFAVVASLFVWIIAPPPYSPLKICGTIRLVIGSSLSAVILIVMLLRTMASPGFLEHVAAITNSVAARQGAGSDVVQTALLAEVTPEMTLNFIRSTVFRGGALISSVLLFFLCRQLSFILARLFAKNKPLRISFQEINSLVIFRVHPMLIWVLSASLLLVVMTHRANLEIPGIILWNILILCSIIYLAQGIGILQFFLARPTVTPFMKLLFSILFVVLMLSPGINVVLFGGVVLLGIAENWVPFRAPKSNGPPSTPEAGSDTGN